MKKILLPFCLFTAFCLQGVNAEIKMSPSTQNFLHSYETTAPAQRSMLKSVYAVSQNSNQTVVSAFLHLNDENNLEGLEGNGVVVNAQYGTILSVLIPADKLEAVSQLPTVKYVEIGRPVRKLMNNVRSAAFTNADALHSGLNLSQAYTGKDVVVGVIDGGLQYNHIGFYDSEGKELRLKRVWNQNKSGNAPEGYHYGTEYTTPEEIIAAKRDESSESHATHVMGIAAGAYKGNDYYGIAPDADLVFVSYNLADNSSSNTSITDGIKYIYDYAESVGKPCVINMSLGHHLGPHDGTSTFDRICDELQGEGRLLVGAAGNEGEYTIHAQKTLTADDTSMKSLIEFTPYWNYYYNYMTSTVDIWGDADKDFTVKVIVYDRANDKIVYTSDAFSTATGTSEEISNPTGILGKVYVATATDPNNHKGNATIDLVLGSVKNNYYVGFEVSSSEGTTVNAWADAYMSWLTNAGSAEFTNGDTNSTMGEIGGTGKRIISVGAYTSNNNVEHYYSSLYNKSTQTVNQLASFSSQGPTVDGRMKPDIAAPGTMLVSSLNSTACQRGGSDYDYVVSIENVNTTNYYYGSMEGTSMAAPVVTGTLATWLQAKPNLTPEQVRDIFAHTAKTDSYTGSIAGVGDNRWGYGKLDAYNGLVYCIGLSGIDETGAPTRPMVYPNPATTECHFLLPNDDQRVSVAIYSLNGSEVYRQYVGDVQAGEPTAVALNGIAPGVYLMRITGEKSLITTKLTVK